jgi:hypothetical protein
LLLAASRYRALRILAGGALVDREGHVDEGVEGDGEMGIGDLVPSPASLGLGDHDSATAQTGEVVGHVGACQPEALGKARRVRRTVEE